MEFQELFPAKEGRPTDKKWNSISFISDDMNVIALYIVLI